VSRPQPLLTVQQAAEVILRAEDVSSGLPFDQKGFVYVIRGMMSGRIKIGFTDRLDARLRSLQSANADDLELLCLFAGRKRLESHLHDRLKKHRLHGEWFESADPIIRLARDTYQMGQHNTLPEVGWTQ
jgi:hypothetical protein